jgi:hypothetical protein
MQTDAAMARDADAPVTADGHAPAMPAHGRRIDGLGSRGDRQGTGCRERRHTYAKKFPHLDTPCLFRLAPSDRSIVDHHREIDTTLTVRR